MHNHLKKFLFFNTNPIQTQNSEPVKSPHDKRIKCLYKNDHMTHDLKSGRAKHRAKDEVLHKKHKTKRHHDDLKKKNKLDRKSQSEVGLAGKPEAKQHRKKHAAEPPKVPEEYNRYFLIERVEKAPAGSAKTRSRSVPAKVSIDPDALVLLKRKKEKRAASAQKPAAEEGAPPARKKRPPLVDSEQQTGRHIRKGRTYEEKCTAVDQLPSSSNEMPKMESSYKKKKNRGLEQPKKVGKIAKEAAVYQRGNSSKRSVYDSESCHPFFYLEANSGTKSGKVAGKSSKKRKAVMETIDSTSHQTPNTSSKENFVQPLLSSILKEVTKQKSVEKSMQKIKSRRLPTLEAMVFSIVDIKPQIFYEETVQKKQTEKNDRKKSNFRNYYDYYTYYDNPRPRGPEPFSDCHKNYDSPNCSVYEEKIIRKRVCKRKTLQTDMHVTEVEISPVPKEDKQEQVNRSVIYSRIPVLRAKSKKGLKMSLFRDKLAAVARAASRTSRLSRTSETTDIPDRQLQDTYRKTSPDQGDRKEAERSRVRKKEYTEIPVQWREKSISPGRRPTNEQKSRKALDQNVSHSKSDTKIDNAQVVTKKQRRARNTVSHHHMMEDNKSADSPNGSVLSKCSKVDDKWSRWQKRKEYSDTVRKNLIAKKAAHKVMPEQVLEVRYLTVETKINESIPSVRRPLPPPVVVKKRSRKLTTTVTKRENLKKCEVFAVDERPIKVNEETETDFVKAENSCRALAPIVPPLDLEELVAPIEEEFEQIINENLVFLQKDFTVTFAKISYRSIEESSDAHEDDDDEWENLSLAGEIELSANNSRDNVGDRPVSEESGYSTEKSLKSSSFFQRPNIKALLQLPPPLPVENYYETPIVCIQKFRDRNLSEVSSLCTIDICSIESIGVQTGVNCSEKSMQYNRISSDDKVKPQMVEKETQHSKVAIIDSSDTSDDEFNKFMYIENESLTKIDAVSNTEIVSITKNVCEAVSQKHIKDKSSFIRNEWKLRKKGYKLWLKRFKRLFKKTNGRACLVPIQN